MHTFILQKQIHLKLVSLFIFHFYIQDTLKVCILSYLWRQSLSIGITSE